MTRLLLMTASSLMMAACATPAAGPPAAAGPGAPPSRAPRHLDTDAWTQAMTNESGTEIHVRNKSSIPILVTEVVLTGCSNLVEPCGAHYPRVRIEAGGARRVMRIRYGATGVSPRFQYRYSVEPADPERS